MALTAGELRRAALREQARRAALRKADTKVDIDRVCHAKQAKLVKVLVLHRLRNIGVLAGRQSGKSHGGALAAVIIGSSTPNVNLVYVTSTYASCKRMAFKPAVEHNRVHGLGGTPIDGDMEIRFPNGTTVYFMGADTDRLIDRLRGIPNLVLVIIDEAGIYDPEKLKTMIEAVRPGLRPMAGTLCVMGTPSRAGKQGTWYDITENAHFDQHRFDYRDNDRVPSFAEVERLIDEELAAMGLTRESAYFKREYLALFEVDLSEKVYQLGDANLVDDMPDDLDMFITGGDIGMSANDALVCLGWSSKRPGPVYVVDQVEAAGQDSIACANMVERHNAKRGPVSISMDPGGLGQKTIKTVQRLYPGIPVLEAQKPPIGVQVRYANDLLQGARGWTLQVLRGSKLAMELAGPTWVDGLVGGQIDEHGKHSDLAPALRYVCIAARPYLPDLPVVLTEDQRARDAYLANIRRAEEQARAGRVRNAGYDSSEFDGSDLDLFSDVG